MRQAHTRALAGALITLVSTVGFACKEVTDETPTAPQDLAGSVVASVHYDTQIMGVVHEANVGEIVTGQIAVQRATDTAVKAFASTMVAEHTTLDTEGGLLAVELGLAPELPDAVLPSRQSAEASQLSGLSGAAFDRAFVAQQVTAHERTLAIIDGFVAKATRAPLRSLLETQLRPHVVQHLTTVQQLRARIGAP
jgi:putative membrane protein